MILQLSQIIALVSDLTLYEYFLGEIATSTTLTIRKGYATIKSFINVLSHQMRRRELAVRNAWRNFSGKSKYNQAQSHQ